MYTFLLNDSQTNMNFKCKLLDLLYFFCSDAKSANYGVGMMSIKTYVEKFVQMYFPLRSSELDKNDISYTYYVNSIDKLLISLDLTRSFDLLQIILQIYSRELQHCCDTQIQSTLTRFIKRVDLSTQMNLLDTYMAQWLQMELNTVNDHERKAILFKKVLFLFLTYCDKQMFIDVICKNLNILLRLFDKEINNLQVSFYSCKS